MTAPATCPGGARPTGGPLLLYLQGASLAAAPESDRDALQARESAANALAKAGMRADARAVYEWLARNAADMMIRDRALRALSRL